MTDPAAPAQPGPGTARRPIVVLLVDDQAMVGVMLGRLLASEPDIEVRCCLRATDAVATANEVRPAVILQDLVMPDLDGIEVIERLRANPTTARTPIILLSGNDDAGSRARAAAAGAAGFLVKLPGKRELIDCIRQAARGESGQGGGR